MAYTTINKSTDYFNTVTYSGNGNNNHTITGVGFDADFVWNKLRSGTDDNRLFDKVRGINKYVESSNTTAEVTDAILSTNSDGYVLTDAGEVNSNTGTYVGWNWKANGAGSANTDGTISSTVSVNTTSGFSIVSYTGTGSNATVGHGLGVTPKMMIFKNRNDTNSWQVYHASLGATKNLKLDLTDAVSTSSTRFNDTEPTSSVFSVGTSGGTNSSGNGMIAYCFAEKKGYSKFGSYVGNGSTDGAFIYTGFKPAFFMAKRSSAAGDPWVMIDNKRNSFNALSNTLLANSADAENTGTDRADFISNGIKIKTTSNAWNANGSTYIYMAFGQSIVGSNNIPATAR
ncbi:hypothetical protein OAA60_02685 [Porticoccaceae bacterium]|nr:hypothetical protein [Porticoccaceae bacterium]